MHAAPMFISVEIGFGTLLVEIGIVGLVLWIVLSISITFRRGQSWESCGPRHGFR